MYVNGLTREKNTDQGEKGSLLHREIKKPAHQNRNGVNRRENVSVPGRAAVLYYSGEKRRHPLGRMAGDLKITRESAVDPKGAGPTDIRCRRRQIRSKPRSRGEEIRLQDSDTAMDRGGGSGGGWVSQG